MKENKTLSIIAIIYGAIIFTLSILIFLGIGILTTIPEIPQTNVNPTTLVIIAGLISALIGALWVIGGLGLLYKKPWARVLLIIMAILSLFSFPLGTIIGILYLIFLFKS